jgi:hypothetical protein
MTTRFQSKYSRHDAFYLRGDLLRAQFGQWDCCDPVAHAILGLVEAQNELADLFADAGEIGVENEDAAFKEIIQKRHAAGERLMEALEDRDSWPDPELGQSSER